MQAFIVHCNFLIFFGCPLQTRSVCTFTLGLQEIHPNTSCSPDYWLPVQRGGKTQGKMVFSLSLSLQRKCNGLNMRHYPLTAAIASIVLLWSLLGAGLGLQCALAVGKGGAGSSRFFQLSFVVIKWSHHWHNSRGLHGLGRAPHGRVTCQWQEKGAAVQMCLQFDNAVNHVVKARWSAQGKLHNLDDIEISAHPYTMAI